jgi:hypothetical protein
VHILPWLGADPRGWTGTAAHGREGRGTGGGADVSVIRERFAQDGMRHLPRTLTAISAALGLMGALCVGYPVFDKFNSREYGDVGFGGVVARTPEYDAWARRNDRWTSWGLAFVTISSVLQLVVLYIPSSSRRAEPGVRT